MTEYCTAVEELVFELEGAWQPAEPDTGIMSGYTEDVHIARVLIGDTVIWEQGRGATNDLQSFFQTIIDQMETQDLFDRENGDDR